MRKILLAMLACLLLSSCTYLHVHKMDIEQGNVLTQEMVNRIHTGMTAGQVKDILGEPVLTNVFNSNRMDYVYTYKPGYGKGVMKYLTLIFKQGRLNEIRGNMYSEFLK